MTEAARSKTRILIGAGSFADAASALRIARRLMQGGAGSLGGLLVAEEDMLAACRIPNQRVVSASGSLVVAPSLSQVQTLMKADAEAFRRLLADIAGSPAGGWTFEQKIGDLIEHSVTVSRGWDILIIGYRDVHRVPGKVIVVAPPHPHEGAAHDFAASLARQLGTDLQTYVTGPAAADAGGQGVLRFGSVEAALSQLARTNVQTVVIDLARGPIRTREELRRLLEVSRCPVVVLGAAATDPRLEHSTQIPPSPDRAPEGGASGT